MTQNLRLAVSTCWVLAALGFLVSVLLEPDYGDSSADTLNDLVGAGSGPAISFFAFAAAQLPFMVAAAGLAVWLYPAAPKLASVGGVLVLLGGFGEAVYSGIEISETTMADDPTNIEIYAKLVDDIQGNPWMIPFLALGLLGTVLGVVVLGSALLRARTEPRWVGPLLWAWIVLVFVGESVSSAWAVYASVLCMAVAFCAIALSIAGSPSATTAPPLGVKVPREG